MRNGFSSMNADPRRSGPQDSLFAWQRRSLPTAKAQKSMPSTNAGDKVTSLTPLSLRTPQVCVRARAVSVIRRVLPQGEN